MLRLSGDRTLHLISSLPSSSPEHLEAILRAYDSSTMQTAYDTYLARWQDHPEDFFANLHCGVAGHLYEKWYVLSHPQGFDPSEGTRLMYIANRSRACLFKAITLRPHSGIAASEYGDLCFYESHAGKEKEKAFKELEAGVQWEPQNPVTHRLLGRALFYGASRQFSPFYDPQAAEHELHLALKLDPLSASIAYDLSCFYLESHKYKQARKAFMTYVRLFPPTGTVERDPLHFDRELRQVGQ